MAKYQQYDEYKDSGVVSIGLVPKNWSVSRLKQVVDQNRQVTYGIVQAGPNVKEGVYYIRPADMTEETGVKNYENLLKTSPEIAASYERSKIKAGDIICSIGPSFGKLMITPEYLDGANLTQGTARVAISSEYNTGYFFWALRSTCSFQQWESSVGGATFRALNLGPLADTFLAIPTNSEQAKIANFLDFETAQIDTLIEKQQTLIQLLKEKRQAVISHAVTKGLNPDAPMKDSGVEWLGEVPEHWTIVKLSYRMKLLSGDGITSQDIEPTGQYPVYGGNGLRGYTDRYNCEGHHVLIGRQGALCGNINLAQGKFFATEHAVVVYPYQDFNISFLSEFLRFMDLGQYSVSAAQPGISVERINGLKILVPPYYEQTEIGEHVENIIKRFEDLSTKANQQIKLLQERRTALISAAVTGKIDVRGWQSPDNKAS